MDEFENFYQESLEIHNALNTIMDTPISERRRSYITESQERLNAFNAKLKEKGTSFTVVFHVYEDTRNLENKILDVNGRGLQPENAAALIEAFREYGVTEFTYSSPWSDATESAWLFLQSGCTLKGMKLVNDEPIPGSTEFRKKPAYLFQID